MTPKTVLHKGKKTKTEREREGKDSNLPPMVVFQSGPNLLLENVSKSKGMLNTKVTTKKKEG